MFTGAGQRNQVLGQGARLARAWSLLHKASVEAVSVSYPNLRACRSFNGLSLNQIQQQLLAHSSKWSQVTLRDQRQCESPSPAYNATLAVEAQVHQQLARYVQWVLTDASQPNALDEKASSPHERELTPRGPHKKPLPLPTPKAEPYERQEQCDKLLPVFSRMSTT
jgi:hypothetical protein